MAGEGNLRIVGYTTAPAELRFSPAGDAVANVTVAVTRRKKKGDQWVDDSTDFYRCAIWREFAENVAESLDRKGIRVFVEGRFYTSTFETKEGDTRVSLNLEVDEIGPSLRFQSVKVPEKAGRAKSNGSGRSLPADDPWAAGPTSPEEPPF